MSERRDPEPELPHLRDENRRDDKPRDDKKPAHAPRFGDEMPSGTFRIPRV